MFLHMSVILSGDCLEDTPWADTPPGQTDTHIPLGRPPPLSRHLPWADPLPSRQTPLWADTRTPGQSSSLGRPNSGQTPLGRQPPGRYLPRQIPDHPPLVTATAADDTHPIGMHSCFSFIFSCIFLDSLLSICHESVTLKNQIKYDYLRRNNKETNFNTFNGNVL